MAEIDTIVGLRGAEVKLWQAQDHLDRLQESIADWRKKNPEPFRDEHDDDRRQWHLRWNFSPLPDDGRWSATFGDFVHNLRSCLDHLTWQLALRQVREPSRKTAFPIVVNPDHYAGEIRRKLANINDADVRAKIEGYQPFHPFPGWSGPFHPLWLIDELDNRDKHQMLHFVVHGIDHASVTARAVVGSRSVEVPVRLHNSPAIHDAPFASVTTDEPADRVEMNVKLGLDVGLVAFGAKLRVREVMEGTITAVSNLLEDFDQAFFQSLG